MKVALTIAGSDSCGGAGIQQDLKVFSSLRVYGVSVITAITAQNTRRVEKSYVVKDPDCVAKQIDALFSDINISAVKTGMLGSKEIVSLVVEKVNQYGIENLVVDPVMESTSGYILIEEEAIPEMKKLISLAKITTPNIKEAEILSEMDIRSEENIKEAAKRIDCDSVIITGGDRGGIDVLYHQNEFHTLKSNLKIKESIHGTGCGFSAAITANLAKRMDILDAVKEGKRFINCSLARNFSISKSKKGLRILDTSNLMRYKDFRDDKKREVTRSVSQAIELFCSTKDSWKLIPEVGINIAMALPKAKNLSEIAGLTGRIVKDRNKAVPVGIVNFYGSSHVGRVVLTAMKFNPEIKAAMNIRFSEEILEICKNLNLEIATFDRRGEPEDTKTMEWGTKKAIEKLGKVPQIIYDRGEKGKEAMVRILGKDAEKLVERALKILKGMD